MMSITEANGSAETVADVLERLGGIAPERVRLHPHPATPADVVRIEQQEHRLFELVDGFLVEKVMGYQEAWVASMLIHALQSFVLPRDLGAVTSAEGMFRFPENLVRMPDVAYASWKRFPAKEIPDEPIPRVVPDLAVEVLSDGNTPREMSRKLLEYFRAGVRLVWFVDPRAKTVTVYTSQTRSKVIPETGTLDGGRVLPGFEMPVAILFSRLKRSQRKSKRSGA
jgi:Uma2 family endonuclease